MGLPKISSVFLHVTNECNCRCVYCFETPRPNFMTFDVAKDIADYLAHNAEESLTIPSINFFGGEPTLCWDTVVEPLVRYIRGRYGDAYQLSMTSNCLLMTEERLRFLADNDIGLLFSIDGDKPTQDVNRPTVSGKSSFDQVSSVIDLIPKILPGTVFRSTTIPATCEHIFHNIMFAEQHGYDSFHIVPDVFRNWPDDSRAAAESEMRKYFSYFVSCFRNGRTPIRFGDLDKAFKQIPRINEAIRLDVCRPESICGACAKCGLGSNRFAAVDHKGDLYGCQELVSCDSESDPFYIGNIYTGVDDERRMRLMQSFHAGQEHGEHCADCRLSRICDGGCVANNYIINGDVDKMPEVYCWWAKFLLDEAIQICNEIGNDPPPLFMEYWRSL